MSTEGPEIQRWTIRFGDSGYGTRRAPYGGWCHYRDHLAALSRERERVLGEVEVERDEYDERLTEMTLMANDLRRQRDEAREEVTTLQARVEAGEELARAADAVASVWQINGPVADHLSESLKAFRSTQVSGGKLASSESDASGVVCPDCDDSGFLPDTPRDPERPCPTCHGPEGGEGA